MKESIKARFHTMYRVDNSTGCWTWAGDTGTRRGYGRMRVGGGKAMRAHRLSYQIHVGSIPDGLCVCHRCDNPPCVNPNHLFLATNEENTADRVRKGRSKPGSRGRKNPPKGEDHPMAKINEKIAAEIKSAIQSGARQTDIASKFNISQSTVSLIKMGKIWSTA